MNILYKRRRGAVRFVIYGLFAAVLVLTTQTAGAQSTPKDIPVEVFAALPTNQSPRLSPDGKSLALIVPYKGTKHLMIRPIGRKGNPVVLPPYKDSEWRWMRWANSKQLLAGLAYTSRRPTFFGTRVQETRLLSISSDGKKAFNMVLGKRDRNASGGSRLTMNYSRAQIQDDVIDFMFEDPDQILLALDDDLDPEWDSEVRRIKVATGRFKEIYRGTRYIQDWTTDWQGHLRFGEGYTPESTKMIYLNPETGFWDSMKGEPIDSDFSLWGFYEDPRFAYVIGKNEAGIVSLLKFDMIEQKPVETVYANENYDVLGVIRRPYGRDPIGVLIATDKIEYHYFDAEWSRRQRMIGGAIKGYVNRIISSTKNLEMHLIESGSDVESGAYYLFDEKNKKLDFIGTKYNGLEPKMLSPMTSITFESRDGLTIPAYLTVPKGAKAEKLPTVILPHGGPHARDVWGYDYWVQFLASRGYAVFQPNFRGSTGYGIAFEEAGRENWGLKMQDDITDGVQMLIEKGIADPDRICIVGGSYGGYAALMGAVKTPDLFTCAASINGVTNLPGIVEYHRRKSIGGKVWTQSIGDPGEDREKLRGTSPYHQVDKIKIPVLLIHSKDDTTVLVSHSRAMFDRLKDRKKKVKFVEIEKGGHSLENEAARITMLKALEKFLAKHLDG